MSNSLELGKNQFRYEKLLKIINSLQISPLQWRFLSSWIVWSVSSIRYLCIFGVFYFSDFVGKRKKYEILELVNLNRVSQSIAFFPCQNVFYYHRRRAVKLLGLSEERDGDAPFVRIHDQPPPGGVETLQNIFLSFVVASQVVIDKHRALSDEVS